MRLFDAVLIISLLAACGKTDPSQVPYTLPAPGTTPTTQPGELPAICKPLASQWASVSDLERHDFSNISKTSAVYTDYSYTGTNGILCPGAGQPMKAQLVSYSHPDASAWPYILQIKHNYPQPGCNNWGVSVGTNTQPYPTYSNVLVKLECDKMTMCQGVYPAPFNCKEFR